MQNESDFVYILRTCDANMRSYGGFEWPTSGMVEAPDWDASPHCGNGLHGFLWGEGDGRLASWNDSANWLVAKVAASDIVDLGGKVKFPRAEVVFVGNRFDATQFIRERGARGVVIGITLTGGNFATLTGGNFATLTGGNFATLTGGNFATLTGGYGATLTGGEDATLTGGYGATLTGGEDATLTGGEDATLIGKYYDGNRYRIAVAYVGKNGIKPNTPYKVNQNGHFIEQEP